MLTAEQANDRVSRIFPRGVASENARAEVGEAPAPPVVVGPEADSSVARRLHGVVLDAAAKPLDTAAARARVVTLEAGLKAHGLTPGSGLALHLY